MADKVEGHKILGWLLFAAGLVLLALSFVSVYQVFTGKVEPYPIFKFQSVTLDLSKLSDADNLAKEDLKQELINSEMFNKPMNMGAHLILFGFLASIGFKIASLGIMLVRPINVKLKGVEDKKSILLPEK